MNKTVFELRRIENNQTEKVVLLNENQLELIFMALSEYQDNIYDEDSPYYSSVDEADFSDLQSKIGEV
jgi:hypothetical protein